MTGWGLALKGLAWHRRSYLAVGASIATTCAVICGALLVGDSVKESLRAEVIERLGRTQHSLVSPGFFTERLVGELGYGREAIPMILLQGSVVHPENRQRASKVNIIGVDERFSAASLSGKDWGIGLRETKINRALADELDAKVGDDLLISFELHSDIPREHALGNRDDSIERLRPSLVAIEDNSGTAIFDLKLQQETPRNVFLSLERLQAKLGREGEVNAIILCAEEDGAETPLKPQERLKAHWELDDIGALVRIDKDQGYLSLESRNFLLDSRLADAARQAAGSSAYQRQEVLSYLANSIGTGGAEIPYSIVSSVSPWLLPSGEPESGPAGAISTGGDSIASESIILNSWAMKDLGAEPGNKITLRYYAIGPDHGLIEKTVAFNLQGEVALSGAALDPGWTPEYPGVSDAETFSDWDPPFPIDHSKIRDPGPDGDYWKEYRTTPKAFIRAEAGQSLWAGEFGSLTSLRIRLPDGVEAEAAQKDFTRRLRSKISPGKFGLTFRPIREEATRSARSGTDFGMLFISMSFFIIIAGLLLTSMTLRLALEGRAKSLGMLGALGFPGARVRGLLVREALLAIFAGALVGLAGGVGYAALLIHGLKTLWRDAVNSPFLSLHVNSQSLAVSLSVTLILVAGTGYFVIRKLSSLPPRRLLSGMCTRQISAAGRVRWNRWRLLLGIGLLCLSGVLCVLALTGVLSTIPAFLGMGGCLLGAGLALFSWALSSGPGSRLAGRGGVALLRLGFRNGRRAPGRSILTAGLISCATFVVVIVAANQRDPAAGEPRKASGDGGFALMGHSTSPIYGRLDTIQGREELSLGDELSSHLETQGVITHSMRERPGDETSCLNLYRPAEPRILGASEEFIQRGGFAWGGTLAEDTKEFQNPWLLLHREWEEWPEGVIPAIGDLNTVQWVLRGGLGADIPVRDGKGRERSLRIVGLLTNSLFQGSLVISNQAFEEMFPARRGHSAFFIESPTKELSKSIREGLEDQLGGFGLDLQSSGAILASFNKVQNTYLSTFMVLGGLGLLLGTLGLGAVLLRNVNERRGELALMKALGYSGRALSLVVLAETLFLIIFGELQGAASALIAAAPMLASSQSQIAWGPLVLVLFLVLAGGVLSCSIALGVALRTPVLAALRSE